MRPGAVSEAHRVYFCCGFVLRASFFSSQLVCRTRSPSSFFGERSRSAGPPSAMPQQTAATAAEPAALLPVRVAVRCWRETAADGEPCVVV